MACASDQHKGDRHHANRRAEKFHRSTYKMIIDLTTTGIRDGYRANRSLLFAICSNSSFVSGTLVRNISHPRRTLPPGGLRSEP